MAEERISAYERSGGNAFPHTDLTFDDVGKRLSGATHFGMTLRDYFMAHVDVSIYDPVSLFTKKNGKSPTVGELAAYIADIRSVEAEAMLKARNHG